MYYDFHIHSALSPCANNEMTPNNIINMSIIKGLDIIAVCDHNSTRQQVYLDKVSKNKQIKLLYGVEVESREEVHILGLFKNLNENLEFGKWIDNRKPFILNNESFFGKQLIINEEDEIIDKLDDLLIVSIEASIEEIIDTIHKYNGKAVLAHALNKRNGIITQLGYIPKSCNFDAIEVKNELQIKKILDTHPWIKETIWLYNSDAHNLVDINEAIHQIDIKELFI